MKWLNWAKLSASAKDEALSMLEQSKKTEQRARHSLKKRY